VRLSAFGRSSRWTVEKKAEGAAYSIQAEQSSDGQTTWQLRTLTPDTFLAGAWEPANGCIFM